jgi:UDP-N-acetylglucosamine--N-acetylmuramyl-(pentapeptide) pyrophosphoryl-undecaprenol N-acetylglucosamine transferase
VALAEGARKRWPDRPIVFVGAKRGIEAVKLPDSGWQHLLLDLEGFLGRSPFKVLKSLWKLCRARRQLMRMWACARPWAVIGTGGYAAAPALLVARSMGIPYFIHESNAEPGALVKVVASRALRVWCGMEAAIERMPGSKCSLVGTPVREVFRRDFTPLETLNPPYRLLVMGGSGGARAINEALLDIAPSLLDAFLEWRIQHQAGPEEFKRLKERNRHERHDMLPFIEDPDLALEAASLVIGRSGASFCAELIACGRPAVLVPMPTSAGDHQRMNAKAMAKESRAILVEQGDAFSTRLEKEVRRLMEDSASRALLSKPDLNRTVDTCLEDLAGALSSP